MTQAAERISAFTRDLHARLSTRIESSAFGTVYLNDAFPRRYDSNFVWIDAPLGGVSAAAVAHEADRVLGAADLDHRQVYVDDVEEGTRLLPGLVGLGYEAERLVTMVRRRGPDRPSSVDADEVDLAAVQPFLVLVNHEANPKIHPSDAEMLARFRSVLVQRANARFFARRHRKRVVSVAELYVLDGVAQVEAVYTLEAFRGRGLGRAVVLAAVRAAHDAGCDLAFLNADDEDWPKEMYGKLGFDELRRSWSFTKPALDPDSARAGAGAQARA